jgi:hypothetical protein
MCDKHAIDPETELPIGTEKSAPLQSAKLCMGQKFILHRDSKNAYETFFFDWFDWATEIQKNGPQGLQPIVLINGQDLSSLQKAIGRGGAVKRIKKICAFCVARSSTLADKIPACKQCKDKGCKYCWHYPVTDKIFRSKCTTKIVSLNAKYQEFPNVFIEMVQLFLIFYEDQLDKKNNKTNIEYKPRSKTQKNGNNG